MAKTSALDKYINNRLMLDDEEEDEKKSSSRFENISKDMSSREYENKNRPWKDPNASGSVHMAGALKNIGRDIAGYREILGDKNAMRPYLIEDQEEQERRLTPAQRIQLAEKIEDSQHKAAQLLAHTQQNQEHNDIERLKLSETKEHNRFVRNQPIIHDGIRYYQDGSSEKVGLSEDEKYSLKEKKGNEKDNQKNVVNIARKQGKLEYIFGTNNQKIQSVMGAFPGMTKEKAIRVIENGENPYEVDVVNPYAIVTGKLGKNPSQEEIEEQKRKRGLS